MKCKEQLIKEGNDLLACVKKAYVHGVDMPQADVMDQVNIDKLNDWHEQVEDYVEKYGLNTQRDRLADCSWIVNHSQVRVERIKRIIKILESVESK